MKQHYENELNSYKNAKPKNDDCINIIKAEYASLLLNDENEKEEEIKKLKKNLADMGDKIETEKKISDSTLLNVIENLKNIKSEYFDFNTKLAEETKKEIDGFLSKKKE